MNATVSPAISVHTAERIREMLDIFMLRKREGDISSVTLGNQVFQLAKSTGEKALIAEAGYELSHFYVDITTDLDKAISIIEEVVGLYDKEKEPEDYARYALRLGLAHDFKGDVLEAKQFYEETIQILENRSGLSREMTLILARAQFNQSIIYGDLEFDALFSDHLERAMQSFRKCDYRGGIARGFISFGVRDWRKKEYDSALVHYENASAIAEEDGDIQPYCIAQGNIAVVQSTLARREAALEAIGKALDRIRQQTNKHFSLSIHELAGNVFQNLGDFELSDFHFREAERIFLEMGKTTDNFNLYHHWSKTLSSLGRTQDALDKLSRAYELREETLRQNKQVAVNDVRLQLQVNESRREQDLLRKKNEEVEEYARKLEISNSELNQFAYVASHDLKEPLRMVNNYAQLLTRSLHGQLSPDQINYLHYLNEGATRMMAIINDLLQLSKIGAHVQKAEVAVDAVISDVKGLLRSQLRQQNIELKVGQLPRVTADRTHLQQLFLNLIANAIKYNRSDLPIVQVTADEGEDHYLFTVEDNGIGIDPMYRDKVFVIFQRLHNRNEYEGSGIGLAICKKIVESMNGKIWIEDASAGGSKFCFTIPKK